MSDEHEVPWLVQQGELLDEISNLLPAEIEGEWTSLTYTNRSLSTYGESDMVVQRPDGTTDESQAPPYEIGKLAMRLRKLMYRDGVGTWLSATWSVTNYGDSVSSTVDFNYDVEPEWYEPVEPGHYALDLEDFPRRKQAVPEWLRGKVAEADARAK